MRKHPSEWEKIFAHYPVDRGLISRIYRKFQNLNHSITNYLAEKMGSDQEQIFFKT